MKLSVKPEIVFGLVLTLPIGFVRLMETAAQSDQQRCSNSREDRPSLHPE
jgi:hypothetical protein